MSPRPIIIIRFQSGKTQEALEEDLYLSACYCHGILQWLVIDNINAHEYLSLATAHQFFYIHL